MLGSRRVEIFITGEFGPGLLHSKLMRPVWEVSTVSLELNLCLSGKQYASLPIAMEECTRLVNLPFIRSILVSLVLLEDISADTLKHPLISKWKLIIVA